MRQKLKGLLFLIFAHFFLPVTNAFGIKSVNKVDSRKGKQSVVSSLSPRALSEAALKRTRIPILYDGTYFSIEYPGGDVPSNLGVCTDLVVRTYRTFGIDLQELVHEDMRQNFSKYPKRWGLKRPDPNIDHRRVPNLRKFFERFGKVLKISTVSSDYTTGDLVTWNVQGRPHIGFVTHLKSRVHGRPLIVHNIGAGPRLEDFLFEYPITGHYRYLPN